MAFEVMETIKNILFNVIVIIGLIAIILLILWGILELLNRFSNSQNTLLCTMSTSEMSSYMT